MTNKIHIFHNAKCVNCQAIEEKMRRVGSVIFCPRYQNVDVEIEDFIYESKTNIFILPNLCKCYPEPD